MPIFLVFKVKDVKELEFSKIKTSRVRVTDIADYYNVAAYQPS